MHNLTSVKLMRWRGEHVQPNTYSVVGYAYGHFTNALEQGAALRLGASRWASPRRRSLVGGSLRESRKGQTFSLAFPTRAMEGKLGGDDHPSGHTSDVSDSECQGDARRRVNTAEDELTPTRQSKRASYPTRTAAVIEARRRHEAEALLNLPFSLRERVPVVGSLPLSP